MAVTYVAEFYAAIPMKGDEPLHVIEVKAGDAMGAQRKAYLKAMENDIKHPYMFIFKKEQSNDDPPA